MRAWPRIERGDLWALEQKAAGSSAEAPGTSRQRTAFGESGSPDIPRVLHKSQGPMLSKWRPGERAGMAKDWALQDLRPRHSVRRGNGWYLVRKGRRRLPDPPPPPPHESPRNPCCSKAVPGSMPAWPRIGLGGLWALTLVARFPENSGHARMSAWTGPGIFRTSEHQRLWRQSSANSRATFGNELWAHKGNIRAKRSCIIHGSIRYVRNPQRTAFGRLGRRSFPGSHQSLREACRANAITVSMRAWLKIKRGALWTLGPKAAGSSMEAPGTSRQRTAFGETVSPEFLWVHPECPRPIPSKRRPGKHEGKAKNWALGLVSLRKKKQLPHCWKRPVRRGNGRHLVKVDRRRFPGNSRSTRDICRENAVPRSMPVWPRIECGGLWG